MWTRYLHKTAKPPLSWECGTNVQRNVNLKLSTMIAQYYGIVKTVSLLLSMPSEAKAALVTRGRYACDESVVVYAWRPTFDYEWTGYRTM